MYTVKIDKHGKVLIPSSVRKSMKLFSGQNMTLSLSDNAIIIKPFYYKCKLCGVNIPEGSEYGSCEECTKKNTVIVY